MNFYQSANYSEQAHLAAEDQQKRLGRERSSKRRKELLIPELALYSLVLEGEDERIAALGLSKEELQVYGRACAALQVFDAVEQRKAEGLDAYPDLHRLFAAFRREQALFLPHILKNPLFAARYLELAVGLFGIYASCKLAFAIFELLAEKQQLTSLAAWACYYLAQCQFLQQDFAEAEETIEQALEQLPDTWDLLFLKAQILEKSDASGTRHLAFLEDLGKSQAENRQLLLLRTRAALQGGSLPLAAHYIEQLKQAGEESMALQVLENEYLLAQGNADVEELLNRSKKLLNNCQRLERGPLLLQLAHLHSEFLGNKNKGLQFFESYWLDSSKSLPRFHRYIQAIRNVEQDVARIEAAYMQALTLEPLHLDFALEYLDFLQAQSLEIEKIEAELQRISKIYPEDERLLTWRMQLDMQKSEDLIQDMLFRMQKQKKDGDE